MMCQIDLCVRQCDRKVMGTDIDVWYAVEDRNRKSVDEVYGVFDCIRKFDQWGSLT